MGSINVLKRLNFYVFYTDAAQAVFYGNVRHVKNESDIILARILFVMNNPELVLNFNRLLQNVTVDMHPHKFTFCQKKTMQKTIELYFLFMSK